MGKTKNEKSINYYLFIIIIGIILVCFIMKLVVYGTGKKKLSSNAVILLCFHFFCRYLEYYKKIIESSDDHYPINYKSNFIYAKRKKQNKKMPYNNTFDLKL